MKIPEFLNRKLNINLDNGITQSNSTALAHAAAQCSTHLNAHLYDAVVGLHESTKLEERLNPAQLNVLKGLAQMALQKTNAEEVKTQLKEFEFMCQRYMDFLSPKAPGTTDILNKKPANAAYPNAVPKHTLVKTGDLLMENLTWMTEDEMQRFSERYSEVGGVSSLAIADVKKLNLHGKEEKMGKTELGAGAFGVVRLGRMANTDEYVAVKKSHPIHSTPTPLKIQAGINDGTQTGIVKVHSSVSGRSSRKDAVDNEPLSTLTHTELGVVDLQDFLDKFRTLRHLFEGGIGRGQAELVRKMAQAELGSTSHSGALNADEIESINLMRLSSSPFRDPVLVRRFLNRMAYQMLESINQMHTQGVAHNDIKPNNFVLSKHNGLYRVKLIDFDLNTDAKKGVGVPREVYAPIYAAPQVNSSEENNQPLLNDAYSAGMSIRQVNGQHPVELAMFYDLIKGNLANELKTKSKPIEDRRRVEAQQIAMPEMANLNQLADLLCHPKAGKRISVQDALRNPVFNQPNSMVSERDFSELATKALRHGSMLDDDILENLYGQTDTRQRFMNEVFVSQQNRHLSSEAQRKEFEAKYGKTALAAAEKRVEQLVMKSNLEAIPRRTGRLLNPLNLFKSADQKDAEYTFKPLARRK